MLEMYHHYGAGSLSEMVGMFAFALYDIDKQTLFIARDHFGIKPLFYTKIGTALLSAPS
jgi:asparagine synthase (glutamine-hydrolysing)